DSLRLYEMFMGPLEQVKPWSTKGVEGVYRFLNRVWRLYVDEESGDLVERLTDQEPERHQLKILHECISKVTEDIEEMRFNTAISALMIFVNEANQWNVFPKQVAEPYLLLLAPFAPHIAEELWNRLGHKESLATTEWPDWNKEFLKSESILYPVQINGKMRGDIEVPAEKAQDKEFVLEKAKEHENVARYLNEGELVKEIFVPNRIVNLVIKPG
ncbi:MAG: class I tRNA ligase family protein, partial [Balneolaceae bacterium]